jgi:3-phenylpropionate/trans-cinnamate dioxygenase ferredoxin subunit
MAYERACAVADVPTDEALGVTVGAYDVAIATHEGEFFAVQDQCTHQAVPLSEGEVEDCTIECWLHGSRFDLRTGKPTGPPAVQPVPVYPVTVDGQRVLVDVDAPL